MPAQPTRCRYGEACRKKTTGKCAFVHPDDPDWQNSRESNYQTYTSTENAWIAETKSGSYKNREKPRNSSYSNRSGANNTAISSNNRKWGEPTSSNDFNARSSSGDFRPPDGPSGSHSRSGSGDKWGAAASGGGRGAGQRRSSGQGGDKPEASAESSLGMWPGSWDSTPDNRQPSSPSKPSSGWPPTTQKNNSPTRQTSGSGGWGGGWDNLPAAESSSEQEQLPAAVDNDNNPWVSIGKDAGWDTSAWATTTSKDQNKQNAASGSGWGSGWAPAVSHNAQSSPVVDSGKGKGKAREDVEMSSQPKEPSAPPTPTSASIPASTFPKIPTPTSSSTPKHPLPTRRQPRVSSNLVPPEARVSAPLPTRRKNTVIQKSMHQLVVTHGLEQKQELNKNPSQTGVQKLQKLEENQRSKELYTGPEGRVRLYQHLIRLMVKTVVAYRKKQKAELNYKQVSAMAASPAYTRPTRRTRKMLEAHKEKAKQRIVPFQEKVNANLKELAIIPSFADDKKKLPDPKKLLNLVVSYTAELQEWMALLTLNDRVQEEEPVVEKRPETKKAPSKSPETPSNSVTSTPTPSALAPRALLEKGTWTWQDVKDSFALMQARLQEIEEEHSTLYTTLNDQQTRENLAAEIDATIEKLTKKLEDEDEDVSDETVDEEDGEDVDDSARRAEERKEARRRRRMEIFQQRFAKALNHLYQSTDDVDTQFRADIVQLGELLLASNQLKLEIGAWKSQREELDSFCREANAKLAEMEAWNVQAAGQLAALREKEQELAELKAELTRAPPQEEPVITEFDYNELLEFIRPIMIERVRREIEPVLQGIHNAAVQYQKDMTVKVEQLVQPAIENTNKLCDKATRGSSGNNNATSV